MDKYITGTTIKSLREKKKMTQSKLAELLNVSDKTISKWETGKGYPDIVLLESIAEVFQVSVVELFSGNAIINTNVSANMLRSNFYVCPVCGNIIHSMGQSVVSCHGIVLPPLEAEEADVSNNFKIERIEDEYYVSITHEMTKQNYISFMAAVSSDKIQMVKLYPQQEAQARFKINDVRYICFYSNTDGLFVKKL